MTWEELAEKINRMSEEQKHTTVTMLDHNDGEFCGLGDLCLVLGHPYFDGMIDVPDESELKNGN
jgi:hypothetical protein